jgi:hypothetical protein
MRLGNPPIFVPSCSGCHDVQRKNCIEARPRGRTHIRKSAFDLNLLNQGLRGVQFRRSSRRGSQQSQASLRSRRQILPECIRSCGSRIRSGYCGWWSNDAPIRCSNNMCGLGDGLKQKIESICAGIRGIPFEPGCDLERTDVKSFRGSLAGMNFAFCEFTRQPNRSGMASRHHSPFSRPLLVGMIGSMSLLSTAVQATTERRSQCRA